jgi:NAD(P)-dependent dehydrogenase (short-subunit alcohol dehydrogenase family)
MSLVQSQESSILDRFLIKGKTIVITGGSRGLGLNFAHTLAQVGANIAVIDVNDQPSEGFSKLSNFGGKYKYYRANVVDYQQLKATIDQIYNDFGSIDGW